MLLLIVFVVLGRQSLLQTAMLAMLAMNQSCAPNQGACMHLTQQGDTAMPATLLHKKYGGKLAMQ